MKKPRPDEITAEIAALKQVRFRVPQSSELGDNHWSAISAQIAVLRDELWSEHIRRRADKSLCRALSRVAWTDYVAACARAALLWREGKAHAAPSADWQAMAEILSRPEEPATV